MEFNLAYDNTSFLWSQTIHTLHTCYKQQDMFIFESSVDLSKTVMSMLLFSGKSSVCIDWDLHSMRCLTYLFQSNFSSMCCFFLIYSRIISQKCEIILTLENQ